MSDNRPPRYVDLATNTVVYRASAFGDHCTRAYLGHAAGMPAEPPPADLLTIFDEGHRCEPVTRAMWDERTGRPTLDDQRVVTLELGEVGGRRVVIRGAIDGLTYDPDGAAILREFKKVRAGASWEDLCRRGIEYRPGYAWQVAAYWHGLVHAGERVVGCEWVAGEYHGDDDLGEPIVGDLHPVELVDPPFSFKAIRDRVLTIERLIAEGMTFADMACDRDMYPCPFWKFHDADDRETVDLTGVDGARDALTQWTTAHDAEADAKRSVKAAADRKKKAAEALRGLMVDAGSPDAKKVQVGDTVLTRVVSHVPERVQTVKAHDKDYFTIKKDKTAKATDEIVEAQ